MSARRKMLRDAAGFMPDFCTPLADPRWVDARDAAHMLPEDPVLGIESDAGQWALPWWIMKNHHVANLSLGGRAMFVVLCEICSSAAAYDPVVEGRRLTFRVEGFQNGAQLALDDQTGSLWGATTGEALEGSCRGRVLERLPLLQSTWQEWVEMYPGSLVPGGEGESRLGHGEGQTPGSPLLIPETLKTLGHIDKRLPHYELVLGVSAGGASRCYPLARLEQAALNDRLGGEDIVVLSRPGSWIAAAFRRRLDGRILSFSSAGGDIVDSETHSHWTLAGRARSGPLAGRQLEYVHSGVEEFFVWAAYHRGTEIFGADPSAPTPAAWSGSGIPPSVLVCINQHWWPRGTRLLHVGSGDGMISAFLAEHGLKVTATESDAQRVRRARASFRGVRRLEFVHVDAGQPARLQPRFDAVLDHGYFGGRLASEGRDAFATNVAAAARPGARFLLLAPAAAEAGSVVERLRRHFEASFHFIDSHDCRVPDAASGQLLPGLALRFVRRGWLTGK
jgi:hypothetical protein